MKPNRKPSRTATEPSGATNALREVPKPAPPTIEALQAENAELRQNNANLAGLLGQVCGRLLGLRDEVIASFKVGP